MMFHGIVGIAIALFTVNVALAGVTQVTPGVSCPTGFVNYFGSKCYAESEYDADFQDARDFCLELGADLISIHSQEENDVVINALRFSMYWIGLRCNQTTGQRTWTDGTPVDYRNVGVCNDNDGFALTTANGAWKPEDLSTMLYVVCAIDEGPKVTTTPTPAPISGGSECGSGYELDENSSVCVKVGAELKTWTDAEAACQENHNILWNGAHLAAIHNKQSNSYIRRLALSQRLTNAIFIGFQFQNDSGYWLDNSEVDYTNFDAGMPNEFFGECSTMQTGSLGGEWTSISCDDLNQLPFACTKPPPCPAVNTFTVSGAFSSPEYPSSRSSGLSCEYFVAASPGSLVLLRFDEFQFVDGDQVILYDGEGQSTSLAVLFGRVPLFSVTSATKSDSFMTKTQSVMKIVHQAGSGSGVRFWHATFLSF